MPIANGLPMNALRVLREAAYFYSHNFLRIAQLCLPLLLLTIPLQVGGGLALIANWNTRTAAFLLAGLTLVINVYMHDFWNSYPGGNPQHEMQNFIKNLGIFAGLLLLAAQRPTQKG